MESVPIRQPGFQSTLSSITLPGHFPGPGSTAQMPTLFSQSQGYIPFPVVHRSIKRLSKIKSQIERSPEEAAFQPLPRRWGQKEPLWDCYAQITTASVKQGSLYSRVLFRPERRTEDRHSSRERKNRTVHGRYTLLSFTCNRQNKTSLDNVMLPKGSGAKQNPRVNCLLYLESTNTGTLASLDLWETANTANQPLKYF